MSHVRRAVACARRAGGHLLLVPLAVPTAANAVDPGVEDDGRRRGRVAEGPAATRRRLRARRVPRLRDPRRRRSRSPRTPRPAPPGAPSEALAAVAAVQVPGQPDPRRSTPSTTSRRRSRRQGAAGKTIVLERGAARARPDRVRPRRRRQPGRPRRLDGLRHARPSAAFNNLLYVALGQRPRVRRRPAGHPGRSQRRPAGDGGWNFIGDPTGTDVDIDTTALAVEALVGRRRRLDRSDAVQGTRVLRHQPAGERCRGSRSAPTTRTRRPSRSSASRPLGSTSTRRAGATPPIPRSRAARTRARRRGCARSS